MCNEYAPKRKLAAAQRENRRQVEAFWAKVNAWVRALSPAQAGRVAAVSRHRRDDKVAG